MNNNKGQGEIGEIIFMLAVIMLIFCAVILILSTITKTEDKMTCPELSNFPINSIPARCAGYFNLTNQPNE